MTPMERDEVMAAINALDRTLGREIRQLRTLLLDPDEGLAPRLRKMEIWKARAEGAKAAYRWLGPVAASIAGGAVSSLIVILATHAH